MTACAGLTALAARPVGLGTNAMLRYLDLLSSIAIGIFTISTIPQIWKLCKNSARSAFHDAFFLSNYAFQLDLWLVIVILILKFRKA